MLYPGYMASGLCCYNIPTMILACGRFEKCLESIHRANSSLFRRNCLETVGGCVSGYSQVTVTENLSVSASPKLLIMQSLPENVTAQ